MKQRFHISKRGRLEHRRVGIDPSKSPQFGETVQAFGG